jgi:hypothetical protein
MRRRRCLTVVGVSLVALAGCVDQGDGGEGSDAGTGPLDETTDSDGDDQPAHPQVSWEFTDRPSENAVEVMNTGGDEVWTDNLDVLVDGAETVPGPSVFDSESLLAGETGTVGVPADSTGRLRIRWTNPDTDQTAVLGSHSDDVQ